ANDDPAQKPDMKNIAFAIRGEDLSPLSPQAPIVMEILKQQGIEISPDAIKNAMLLGQLASTAMAATPTPPGPGPRVVAAHGGKVPQMPSLDKHQVEAGGANQTGALLPDANAQPGAAGIQ